MSGKRYHVFLSHNSADKPAVELLAKKLVAEGIKPFLDKWHLIPGNPWQEALENALDDSETCAVFLGPDGPGTWENEEMRMALDNRARNRIDRVFAVFLPGTPIPNRGDLPPSLKRFTYVDFRSGLQDADAFRLLLSGIRGEVPVPPPSRIGSRPDTSSRVERRPYRGLEPFTKYDTDIFCGREGLTRYLIERFRGRRFLAIVGPSGSGKSSLVLAGLIPALKDGALPGSENWKILYFKPGRDPLRELAAQLLREHADPYVSLIDQIDHFAKAMEGSFCALAAEVRRRAESHILLVVDQFEEVFTQTSLSLAREAFFANLLDATGIPSAKISVVVTLRADFYASVAAYKDLAERIDSGQVIVTPMFEHDLWDAITLPATRLGFRFEDGLVDEILREMEGQTGALPLLQQALSEIWERRAGDLLTFSSYNAIRGVKGAIAVWAESVYERLSDDQKSLARRVLVKLVQSSTGVEDTRRRLLMEELVNESKWGRASELENVMEHLTDARLLTAGSDTLSQKKLVEISHESLLKEWPRLREWLAASRESRLTQLRVQERIKAWEQHGSGSLARGAELAEFERWSLVNPEEVDSRVEEYLGKSREIREEEAKYRKFLQNMEYSPGQDIPLEDLDLRGTAVRGLQAVAISSQRTANRFESRTPALPDLEISIRLDSASVGNRLVFEVHTSNPNLEEEISLSLDDSTLLAMNPKEYFIHLYKDIEGLPLDTKEARQALEQKLAIKGLAIWSLFPPKLQKILWKRRRSALSLLLQSDEVYIPWEIAKLQSQERDGRIVSGPFLCEAFAVTRWMRGIRHKTRLPLRTLAIVTPSDSKLHSASQERDEVRSLAERFGRKVIEITPKYQPVRDALAAGTYDGWHLIGHGATVGEDPDRWSIRLEGLHGFSAEDLRDETANLGLAQPLVFFNVCSTDQRVFSLASLGRWSHAFLKVGAGAFLGADWSTRDSKAREFALAVYTGLFLGLPIGEAVREARWSLHKKYKGDPTWLAYRVYAHPLASCEGLSSEVAWSGKPPARKPSVLKIPLERWREDVDSPGALLHAEFGVVPFHSREREIGDLQEWCHDPAPVRVRLYTGPGGMGKTRLALEAALRMRQEGWWAGFVTQEGIQSPEKTWRALVHPESKVLLIVDYAETQRPFLISVLREMYRLEGGQVRLLLLARSALDWWEQLKTESEGVGELLCSPATSRVLLAPLADSIQERVESYDIAIQAFAERLARSIPAERLDDFNAKHFERVLLLHLKALIDVEGEKAIGEGGVLDRILDYERSYWTMRARYQGIARDIIPGIGRAMAVITLGGGVLGESEAVEVLRGLQFFADQPTAVLISIARLLHECYPGERWIEPLQPDLLGEHLVQRELEEGADELFDLVLGPRGGP